MMTLKFRYIKAALICASQRLVSLWLILFFNLCLPVLWCGNPCSSQDALKYLKIKGMVVENNENALEGAKAILYKNSIKIDEKYTSKDGRFFFTLELNQRYLVEVTKLYYITKKISFSTTVPPDIKVIYPYKFTINIFKHIEGIDYSVLKNPIAHVKYYSEANKFDYDEDYTNSIMAKLEKLYEQIAQKEAAPPQPSPKGGRANAQESSPHHRPTVRDRPVTSEGRESQRSITPAHPTTPSLPTAIGRKGESPRAGKVLPLGEDLGGAGVIYKMQIVTSRKSIPLIAANFNGLEDVNEYFDNGLYKYTVGETTNYKYATTVLKERIRSSGFKNAFVVSFKDNKRIYEKYKDENISTKLKEDEEESVKTIAENADSRPSSQFYRDYGLRRQEQKTKAFLNRKNAELETKALKKQMEKERETDKIQEVKDKLAIAKSRKIFLEEIADSKRTMKKRQHYELRITNYE